MAQIIWTNHALDRLVERRLTERMVEDAINHPDHFIMQSDKTMEFQKRYDTQTVYAIVKKNEVGEFVIVSCWINPPYPGTKDYKKRQRYLAFKHASWRKKLWLYFLETIGL